MKVKPKIIFYLLAAFSLLIIGAYVISALTKDLQVKEFTQSLGVWGYLFLLLGIAIGGIIVPLSSLPFLLAGLALYGFWTTFILYYLGNTIIAPIIDFWIARKFGRPAVLKLAGKKALKQIDKIAEVTGVKALAILRLFGGVLFDSVSYAMGLTSIPFKIYFWLTSLLPIPGMLLTLYLIEKGMTDSFLFFALIVVWGYLVGILTIWFATGAPKMLKLTVKYKRLPLVEFMQIYHKVPRAAIDVVIKTEKGILLTKRAIPPYRGMWHIPGGTILFKETIRHAIKRVVDEELGVQVKVIKHLAVIEYFEEDGRHTISNAYLAEIVKGTPRGSKQGEEIGYFKEIPENCIPKQKEFLSKILLDIF